MNNVHVVGVLAWVFGIAAGFILARLDRVRGPSAVFAFIAVMILAYATGFLIFAMGRALP